MNARQRRFVELYIAHPNATQAAIDAGYSVRSAGSIGEENLKKPEIAEAIAKGRKKVADKLEITAEMVVKGLHDEATRFDDQGAAGARVKSWELLGKHIGIMGDKLHLTGDVRTGPRLDLSKLNDEQLKQFAALVAIASGESVGQSEC